MDTISNFAHYRHFKPAFLYQGVYELGMEKITT